MQERGYDVDHRVFDATIDAARTVAEKYFANHNAKGGSNEPTFDGESVELIPETKEAGDAFAEAGRLDKPWRDRAVSGSHRIYSADVTLPGSRKTAPADLSC